MIRFFDEVAADGGRRFLDVDGFVTAFEGPKGILLDSYALKPRLARVRRAPCSSVSSRRSPAARRTITFPKTVMTGAVAFPTHWDQ